METFGHVMVDLETLGTESGSVILSIAAVPFDIGTGTQHDAVDDCLHQIRYCSAIWNSLKK